MGKKVQMNVRIDEDMLDRLRAMADRQDRSVAAQLRIYIDRGLKRDEGDGSD